MGAALSIYPLFGPAAAAALFQAGMGLPSL